MQIELTPTSSRLKNPLGTDFFRKYWFNCLVLFVAFHLVFSKNISISFNMKDANRVGQQAILGMPAAYNNQAGNGFAQPANLVTTASKEDHKHTTKKVWKDRKANHFRNLTPVLSPDYAQRKNIDPRLVQEKLDILNNYVAKYADIAIREMERYNIPASITLAQGLLESDAGFSRLSLESQNHFGIKCKSKCKGCTCRNYADDDVYDMFRVFDSPEESYREHSILLQSKRYRGLFDLSLTDYKGWAKGLRKAGYATDKRYAEKLIKIIEALKLYRYDR